MGTYLTVLKKSLFKFKKFAQSENVILKDAVHGLLAVAAGIKPVTFRLVI